MTGPGEVYGGKEQRKGKQRHVKTTNRKPNGCMTLSRLKPNGGSDWPIDAISSHKKPLDEDMAFFFPAGLSFPANRVVGSLDGALISWECTRKWARGGRVKDIWRA